MNSLRLGSLGRRLWDQGGWTGSSLGSAFEISAMKEKGRWAGVGRGKVEKQCSFNGSSNQP